MGSMFFYYDLCAILICLTLIFALISRKLVKGRNNMLFLALVVVVFLTAFSDIFATSLDQMQSLSSRDVVFRSALYYLYFLCQNITAPLYILYVCSYLGLWHRISNKGALAKTLAYPFCLIVALLISNPFTHMTFYIDEDYHFKGGVLTWGLYIIGFYFILFGIYLVHVYGKFLDKGKRFVLGLFLPVSALVIAITILFPKADGEVFVTTLLLIIMAITVQRPEEMADFVVGTNSYSAFLADVKKCYEMNSPQCFMFVKFTNSNSLRRSLGIEYYSMLLRNIADKLYRIEKSMKVHGDIYYLDNGNYAVITSINDYENLLDLGRITAAYLQEPMNLNHLEVMLDARVCIVRTPEDIANEADLHIFAKSFHNKLPEERRMILLSKLMSSKDFRLKNDMDTIISRGIKNRNFEMYYQPIYSIKKKRFVSAEALIRLKDPQYGFVSPAIFIPAAEESGAIHQIGDYVLEEVFRFISRTNFEKLGLEYIEINLSVAQCIEANLYEKISGLMKKYNVKPEQVNLEITETSVDYDPETTDQNIRRLHDMGLSFSLDDYGTGYSNITRVVSLPLDIVKLDKTLVDEMDTQIMSTVISNTVSMLKRMDKKILVEGVEEYRQYMRFEELECDYIQGYFFSKPLPEKDYIRFIEEKNISEDD